MNPPITPVIAVVPRQRKLVDRLIQYCFDLDGTDVKTINIDDTKFKPIYPFNEFACRQNYALRCAAEAMKGQPFMWLETDSIPLHPDWLQELTNEYHAAGKEFMLSADTHPPQDIVGGIGIYGPDTHFLIPTDISQNGWDLWTINHLKPLIHFSTQIQHSYGIYEGIHVKFDHLFPRDGHMLRPGAQIFHKDKHQSLIGGGTPFTFYHSGDLGDIIAALPVIKQFGGGHLVIGDKTLHGMKPRAYMEGERYNAIEPLLKQVPYILSVRFENNPGCASFDFSDFRHDPIHGEDLATWQGRHVGVQKLNLAPWLSVGIDFQYRHRVVFARSPRYHNHKFPWKTMVEKYKGDALFVGLPEEYEAFVKEFGYVEYRPTKDLLEVAQVICGSRLFVGNQSSPCWLAMAMGKPVIQEMWPLEPNSRIRRPNAVFVLDELDLE